MSTNQGTKVPILDELMRSYRCLWDKLVFLAAYNATTNDGDPPNKKDLIVADEGAEPLLPVREESRKECACTLCKNQIGAGEEFLLIRGYPKKSIGAPNGWILARICSENCLNEVLELAGGDLKIYDTILDSRHADAVAAEKRKKGHFGGERYCCSCGNQITQMEGQGVKTFLAQKKCHQCKMNGKKIGPKRFCQVCGKEFETQVKAGGQIRLCPEHR